MKVRSVSEFTNKLSGVFICAMGCFIVFFIMLANTLLLFAQNNEKTALIVKIATMPSLYLLFLIVSLFLLALNNTADDYDNKMNRNAGLAQMRKGRLAILENLLARSDEELAKEKIVILSMDIGNIGLKTRIAATTFRIDPAIIRSALEQEELDVLQEIEEDKKSPPEKPRAYAFLEKRLHLTPIEV